LIAYCNKIYLIFPLEAPGNCTPRKFENFRFIIQIGWGRSFSPLIVGKKILHASYTGINNLLPDLLKRRIGKGTILDMALWWMVGGERHSWIIFIAPFNENGVWKGELVRAHRFPDTSLNICIEYTSPWTRFEFTTLVVIGIDCTSSCKSNYHTITASPGKRRHLFIITTTAQEKFYIHLLYG
jgi:hypothetical protein